MVTDKIIFEKLKEIHNESKKITKVYLANQKQKTKQKNQQDKQALKKLQPTLETCSQYIKNVLLETFKKNEDPWVFQYDKNFYYRNFNSGLYIPFNFDDNDKLNLIEQNYNLFFNKLNELVFSIPVYAIETIRDKNSFYVNNAFITNIPSFVQYSHSEVFREYAEMRERTKKHRKKLIQDVLLKTEEASVKEAERIYDVFTNYVNDPQIIQKLKKDGLEFKVETSKSCFIDPERVLVLLQEKILNRLKNWIFVYRNNPKIVFSFISVAHNFPLENCV